MITSNPPSQPQAKLVSLYRVVDQLLSSYNRAKKDHRKFFINEVPRNLAISAGKNMMDSYFSNLSSILSADHGTSCIRISARSAENEVKLYIKKSEIRGFSFSGIRIHAA